MKTETRYKQVSYEVYITDDGKEFTHKGDAEHHEKELSGDIKKCTRCNGKGRINDHYVTCRDTWSCKEEQVLVNDMCPECKGKGYFEKKWI